MDIKLIIVMVIVCIAFYIGLTLNTTTSDTYKNEQSIVKGIIWSNGWKQIGLWCKQSNTNSSIYRCEEWHDSWLGTKCFMEERCI